MAKSERDWVMLFVLKQKVEATIVPSHNPKLID